MSTAQSIVIEKCLLYTLEKTKNSSAPKSRQGLFNDFMKGEKIQGSQTFLNPKIPELIAVLATMDEVTVEDKARWMFVTSTSFTYSKVKSYRKFNGGLQKLKEDIEDAGVAVYNDRSQIIKYTDKDGHVKFEGVHSLLTGTIKVPRKYQRTARRVIKSRNLVSTSDEKEGSSEDKDAESIQKKRLVKKAPSTSRYKASKSTKTPVRNVRKSASKSKEFIETSSDESDEEDVVRKTPPAQKPSRKRSINTSKTQEVAAVSNEAHRENLDPSESQSLQDSPKEPCSKRLCIERKADAVLEKIASIKIEIDDDIIFDGIVVQEKKEKKPVNFDRIFPCRPSILGGMNRCQYEELEEEEEVIRNIHTLGFLNGLKQFVEKVWGITNLKIDEIQKEISHLIQKVEIDLNFMASDVRRLYAIWDNNLGRLAAQATNKERASGQEELNFLSVLEVLKESCETKLTPELQESVIKIIEDQIHVSQRKKEIITWDSMVEVIRRVMIDIKY